MLSRCMCLFFNLSIRSVLTFTDPSEEDLGLYTVEMSDNPNLSSSYDFTAEGKSEIEEKVRKLLCPVHNFTSGTTTNTQTQLSLV